MKEFNIRLTVNELNLVLEALGNQAYVRVYELINEIQSQAKEQLNGSSTGMGVHPEKEGQVSPAKAEMHSN